MDLNGAVRETAKVSDEIVKSDGQRWDGKLRFIDLVEEVGELANAIMAEHGHKNPKRRKSEVADSICDILFSLLLFAHAYGIDLEKEYAGVLERIRERNRKGDFTG